MSLPPQNRRLHDAVARRYNSATGLIARKNDAVLGHLRQRWPARQAPLRVLDLGVGDGALLAHLGGLPAPLRATGLDVSGAMLALAAGRVPGLATVQAPAQAAAAHLPAAAFDLVLAHFIFAYVPRPQLLEQARLLLAPGGVLSVATSTYEGSEPLFEVLNGQLAGSRHPARRLLAWATRRAVAASHVPRSFAALAPELAAAGWAVERRHTLREPLCVASAADAFHKALEEGWAANLLAVPGLPVGLGRALVRYALGLVRYPVACVQVVEILELRRAAD